MVSSDQPQVTSEGSGWEVLTGGEAFRLVGCELCALLMVLYVQYKTVGLWRNENGLIFRDFAVDKIDMLHRMTHKAFPAQKTFMLRKLRSC